VVGATAEWIFRKPQVLSVTISAADRIIDHPAEELRSILWDDTVATYQIPAIPMPPARIVKERRATFLADPEQLLRRPTAVTRWQNLLLAGDYTETGLPATIEGAIGSGFTAARCVLSPEHRRHLQVATRGARPRDNRPETPAHREL
jgi:hydroxysqualene dehydroxylase